jgi:diguanylate cyclase (GGDEF)-like protein
LVNVSKVLEIVRFGIVRHRVKILDAGFLLVVLAVATLFAFEVDIFDNAPGVSRKQETIELDELLVLTTLVMGGVLFYTWRRAAEHKRENALRVAAEKEVLSLALQDPLTGLPNRRQFDGAIKTALGSAPTAPEAHAVFLVDLNGFKKINDVHGHPVGDQVLIHVGSRLMRAMRDGDLVARMGGDEFAVLARNVAGAEGAATIALRMIESLAAPVVIGDVRHTVGCGIGVALSPHDGCLADDLMRKADVALYRAKAEKASAVRFFEPEMDARVHERDALERALRESMDSGAFAVWFQPSQRAGQAGVAGFQAVARWPHPTLGALEAERFLPIAEEAGVLGALTEQLLRKAAAAAAAWPADVRLSFTLPGALLADRAFGLRILAALAASGLSPDRLDLEVDEGALIRDAEAAGLLLNPLRASGVSLVASHFGTGYSDLRNLNKLQLDRVKLDRSFVSAMTDDRQAAVMVRALIGIGQGLDIDVIADGVGTAAQQAALAAQGVNQGQGALFGGPLTAEDAARLARPGAADQRAAG